MPTPLQMILSAYRATSQTERGKGSYFEELIRTYFLYEPSYADLYSDVWLFGDWAKYKPSMLPSLKPNKYLRPHQTSAKTKVGLGFQNADQGKLIIGCGAVKKFPKLKLVLTSRSRVSFHH